MKKRALLITNRSSFCQDNIQEFQHILSVYRFKVREIKTITEAQEILRKSEENMIVFCFCSTKSEKRTVLKVLKKEIYPIVIIMPYNNDPDCPFVKCSATVYTTLPILPLISMVVVP